jgi:hypothetical protein
MNLNNIFNSKKSIYIILFLIAFAVVFSSTYNPMNFRRMHVDSSVYITISQGIIRGQLPYVNFVDNKGPITFFLNIPGLFLGGFTGIWFTELLLMYISILFAYKTALLFGDKNKALIGTVFSFVILLSFLTIYAGTEEYSLPFLMVSFYIFTKYLLSKEMNIKFSELIVLGICFACAIMIRLNMFPLWVGFCIVIFLETILKRSFLLAGKYVLFFSFGICIIIVPIYFYFKINGILDDFIAQVVFGGVSRGFGTTSLKETTTNFFLVINKTFSIAPVFFGIYFMIIKFKKPKFPYYLSYTLSYFLMVLFLSFSGDDKHYNIALIPFFIPVLTVLVSFLYNAFPNKKYKYLLINIFLCFLLLEGIAKYLYDFSKIFFDESGKHIIAVGKLIDENTASTDKILCINNSYIYPFTQRAAVTKFIYQGSGINSIPGAREDFLSDVLTNKPAIIVLTNADGNNHYDDYYHAPIFEMIEKEYRILSDENGFKLFIRE